MISEVKNASFSHLFCVKIFSPIRQFSLFCVGWLHRLFTQNATNSANIAGHNKPKAVLLNDELKVALLKLINFLLLRAIFMPNLIGGLLLIILSIG